MVWYQFFPDSKFHEANMGPTWVLSAPDGPHVGPMNIAIRVVTSVRQVDSRALGQFYDRYHTMH